jgi:molybdate transport system substrate-binding protein
MTDERARDSGPTANDRGPVARSAEQGEFVLARRRLTQALLVLPVFAVATRAEAATTDIVLTCDTTLGPAMRVAAHTYLQRTGVRVRVFPTGPGLVLPQLARGIQNDVVCTQKDVAANAVRAGLIGSGAPQGGWRNRLVIAASQGAGPAAVKGRVAVSDPTPGSDMDGPAIIRALNLGQISILGVIDTDEVVYLLSNGQADVGLLHMTDVYANPGLEVVRILPDGLVPPITYTTAVTKLSTRPNPQAFIDFLFSPPGRTLLKTQGLEA